MCHKEEKNIMLNYFGIVLWIVSWLSMPAMAETSTENKGICIGKENGSTLCLGFNRVTRYQASLSWNKPTPQAGGQVISRPRVDVDFQYRYSGPQGNGKAKPLDNGTTLKSGDKFTITVEANKDVYVYLFHYDSHQQFNELLSLSGHPNRIKAGQKLMLPAKDAHFVLDDHVGEETIHTIVSTKPLDDLHEQYRKKLLRTYVVYNIAKGLDIGEDTPSKAEAATVGDRLSGRSVACLAPEDACRESFTIRHVAK